MRTLASLLTCVAVSLACSGDVPTNAEAERSGAHSPSLAVAGNSGCVTPRFNVSGVFDGFGTQTVSGDLIGTVAVTFTGIEPFTGVTNRSSGIAEWEITGGVAGPLTFTTKFENRNHLIANPSTPAGVAENRGRHRALSGVQKANFTYEGTFTVATANLDHDYRGVLCP